jgi:DNA repair proteins
MENLFAVNEIKLTYKTKVKASERYQVFCSMDMYKVLMKVYDCDTMEYKEYFKVILLNQANKVLGVHNLSEGGIDGTYADVRQILQIALLTNATGIIISHNHPSGNTEPSINDKRLTNAINQACKVMNIQLLDHLIVTTESYYSFGDNGMI